MRKSNWLVLSGLLITVGCTDGESATPAPEDAATCATLDAHRTCLDEPDPACFTATADGVIDTPLSERNMRQFIPPYGTTDCPGRLVIDIPTSAVSDAGAWISNVWNSNEIATEAACNEVVLNVRIYRQLTDGQWKQWDSYDTLGHWDNIQWQPGACITAMCSGGKLEDGTTNDFLGFPWSWLSGAGTDRIRILVGAYGRECEQRQVLFLAADNP